MQGCPTIIWLVVQGGQALGSQILYVTLVGGPLLFYGSNLDSRALARGVCRG